jgi:hypothetical protein
MFFAQHYILYPRVDEEVDSANDTSPSHHSNFFQIRDLQTHDAVSCEENGEQGDRVLVLVPRR